MVGANFMDEMDCGSFFDNIDDFLDFPTDNLDSDLTTGRSPDGHFQSILPGGGSPDALFGTDSVFSGNGVSDLSAELSVPYEDIVQLEWLSNFVEDSFSGGGAMTDFSAKDSSSSPVSVLDSTSSSSIPKPVPATHEKRARSKRPRPTTFTPRPAIRLIPSPKKTKKIKILPPTNPNPNPTGPAVPPPVRKCMHCEITKTPQWRAGPTGPKTLCNACGVRYKSGRLFPEYRPAASPTFVPSVHSNSHKKVIEMRIKTSEPNSVESSDIP